MNKPTIADAKELAKKCGTSGVLVLAFDTDDFAGASYGVDRRRCTDMGSLLDEFMRMIGDAEVTVWSD